MGFWAVTTFHASRWSNTETRTGLGGHLGAPWPHVPFPLQPRPGVCTHRSHGLGDLAPKRRLSSLPQTDRFGRKTARLSPFPGCPQPPARPHVHGHPDTPKEEPHTAGAPRHPALTGNPMLPVGCGGTPCTLNPALGTPGDPTSGGGHPSPSPRCKARGEAAASAPHPRQETTAKQFCFNCKKKKKN